MPTKRTAAKDAAQESEKGPNKRLLQGARSRDEILDAAMHIMSSRGFDGTSVADIARESGLPNSSLYWHFDSKAGILAAVMERGAERFFETVKVTDESDGDSWHSSKGDLEDPEAYLTWAMQRSSESFVAHPEFLRLFILLLLSNNSPEIVEIVQRVRRQGEANFNDQIRRAFRGAGPEVSEWVADELTPYAMALFDGAFLASQASPATSHLDLMTHLAQDLARQGQRLVSVR